MGTFVEITLHAISPTQEDQAHEAINAAFARIEHVQQLMSFQQADSELSQLNQTAYLHPVQVNPLTYAVLKRVQKLFKESEGLFDCTIADTLVSWNMLPDHHQHSSNSATQAQVKLLPDFHVYYHAPLLLDLSGIAKGFAVDLAIHTLRHHGVQNAIVNAGGDLRVLGQQSEPIFIRNPSNLQQLLPMGELSAGAFATSGIYYSEQQVEEQTVSALVNPLNRQAITQPYSYSVIAKTAWLADGLTKVLAISGNIKHPCLQRFGATGIIVK